MLMNDATLRRVRIVHQSLLLMHSSMLLDWYDTNVCSTKGSLLATHASVTRVICRVDCLAAQHHSSLPLRLDFNWTRLRWQLRHIFGLFVPFNSLMSYDFLCVLSLIAAAASNNDGKNQQES